MKKRIIIAIVLTIILLLSCVLCGCTNLNEKEEKMYELVLAASYKFKDPTSVRIISGTLFYWEITEENNDASYLNDYYRQLGYYLSAEVKLSATTVAKDYDIKYNEKGKIVVESALSINMCDWEEYNIDYKKINKKLKKKWGVD